MPLPFIAFLMLVNLSPMETPSGAIDRLLMAAVVIFNVIGILMLQIKRVHDLNHAGWYILQTAIPLIGIICSIEIAFHSGTYGPNGYGDDPRI